MVEYGLMGISRETNSGSDGKIWELSWNNMRIEWDIMVILWTYYGNDNENIV